MAVDARNILLDQLKKTFGYVTLDDKIVIPSDYKYKLSDFSVICKFQSFYVIEALEEENEHLEKNEIRKIVTYLKTKAYPEFLLIVSSSDGGRVVLSKEIRIKKEEKNYKRYKTLIFDPVLQNENLFWNKIANFDASKDGIDMIELCRKIDNSLNTEKVTKKFYTEFQKQHKAFLKLIEGITDEGNREWYASLMLNRLMFTYFIQQQGFLDNNKSYLADKLKEVKQKRGKDNFYDFYKKFLMCLFHDGFSLKETERSKNVEVMIGKIPYLNGGLFDRHEIEINNNIRIPDKAFEELFRLFDQYTWYLDDKPSGKENEINPDVLGYIFEKYINQKQMGAYYTKEDITGYISKNTIIPFLFEKVKQSYAKPFTPKGEVWKFLQKSGDTYIYDAIKTGIPDSDDIFSDLPDVIRQGFDADLEQKIVTDDTPHLFEKRKYWNTKTLQDKGLPTEIWRETIERRKRYKELKQKIENGEIQDINDLITYNLNTIKFTEDLLYQTDDQKLIAEFFIALTQITVLDPTCGSGAFLFAALNILQPLYLISLKKMRDFVYDEESTLSEKIFIKHLDEVKKHPNDNYYINKTIILNNLYGVDIMHEAVEIAKLRLFLKLASCAEYDVDQPNFGLEPLPDIDFNIKAGNTLVGFARFNDVLEKSGGDIFRREEIQKMIDDEAEVIDKVYKAFRNCQMDEPSNSVDYHKVKKELQLKLTSLNSKLNIYLASDYGIDDQNFTNAKKLQKAFDEWKETHQPFHWCAEFYNIIEHNGGFDVIIGNPPYVKNSKINYSLEYGNYKSLAGRNIYSLVIERSYSIGNIRSYMGMITPVSICSGIGFISIMDLLFNKKAWVSSFSNRPGKLFDGVEQRLSVFISSRIDQPCLTSPYQHWYSEERETLFSLLRFIEAPKIGSIPLKAGISLSSSTLKKFCKAEKSIQSVIGSMGECWFHDGPTYWVRSLPFYPSGNTSDNSSHYHCIQGKDELSSIFITSILASSSFYFFYKASSNCRDFGMDNITSFRISDTKIDFTKLIEKYKNQLKKTAVRCSRTYPSGIIEYDEYYPSSAKDIIDQIDTILAQHYNLSEEELDYIINYDIKYRMGNELDAYVNGTLGLSQSSSDDEEENIDEAED